MNRPEGGFSLVEMLIVVAIIAVLAGVGSSYYQQYTEDAKESMIKYNLQAVREAISRYYKDRLEYPTSFDTLRGTFLHQSVKSLLLDPAPGRVEVEVEAGTDLTDDSRDNWVWTWQTYDFDGVGSGDRQVRKVRIIYQGSLMNW